MRLIQGTKHRKRQISLPMAEICWEVALFPNSFGGAGTVPLQADTPVSATVQSERGGVKEGGKKAA